MKNLLKRRNPLKAKGGFTLIEMIVVLIIIAVLAASAIPGMMRYVDEARQKALLSQCRTIYIAAQTVATKAVTEGIDGDSPVKGTAVFSVSYSGTGGLMNNVYKALVTYYADMDEDEIGDFDVVGDANGKVLHVTYERNDDEVTINSDGSVDYD